MTDQNQEPKSNRVQGLIARPFIAAMVVLVILELILSTTRNPYEPYIMPAIVLVFVLMMATLGLYNKARYGVYLPFKKEGRDYYKKRMDENSVSRNERSKIGWIAIIFAVLYVLIFLPLSLLMRNVFGIDDHVNALLQLVVFVPVGIGLSTVIYHWKNRANT